MKYRLGKRAQEVAAGAARLLGRLSHSVAAGAAVRTAGGIQALLRLLQRPGSASPSAGAGAAMPPTPIAIAVAEAVTVLCAGQEVNQDAVRRGSRAMHSLVCLSLVEPFPPLTGKPPTESFQLLAPSSARRHVARSAAAA